MKKIVMMAMLGAAFIAAGCSRDSADKKAGGGNIQIKGSDTMVNLGQAWAEAFMKKTPGVSLAVTGGGSGTGFAALIGGTATIAESSRQIKQKEIDDAKGKGVTPSEYKVALDGLAVVVNPANPVSSLTIAQLADIYTGKITDWKDVGGNPGKIVILSREVNSGTHVYFKEHVLNGGDSKGTVEFSPAALLMPTSQAIADEVTGNADAIGYYGMGYISPKQKAIRVAKDASAPAVEPTEENVLSGAYPISRPLFFYTNGEPAGEVKAFIDFVLSPDGQAVAEKLGFVGLK